MIYNITKKRRKDETRDKSQKGAQGFTTFIIYTLTKHILDKKMMCLLRTQ